MIFYSLSPRNKKFQTGKSGIELRKATLLAKSYPFQDIKMQES